MNEESSCIKDPGKKKVLVLTSTFPRFENDTEPRFVLDLAIELSKEFDVTVLAPKSAKDGDEVFLDGIRVERFSYAPFLRWQTLTAPGAMLPNLKRNPALWLLLPVFLIAQSLAILRMIRQNRYDLIHCHWLLPQGFALRCVALFSSLPPVVLTCHGGDVFAVDTALMKRVKVWILKRFGYVTCVSDQIIEKITSWFDVGSCPLQMTWISMGVNTSLFRSAGKPLEGELSIDEGKPFTILFVGRLAEKKGVGYLLEALTREGLEGSSLQLNIVGDGPLLEDILAQRAVLGLEDRVTLDGAVSHANLPVLMRQADVFCAPFVVARDGDQEGLPTVLLEAAAAGLPLISTPVGGVEKILVDGENGLLVPSGDAEALATAVARMMARPELSEEYGMNSRRQAAKFDWSQIGQRYISFMKTALREEEGS